MESQDSDVLCLHGYLQRYLIGIYPGRSHMAAQSGSPDLLYVMTESVAPPVSMRIPQRYPKEYLTFMNSLGCVRGFWWVLCGDSDRLSYEDIEDALANGTSIEMPLFPWL